jgi:hypothetical protein
LNISSRILLFAALCTAGCSDDGGSPPLVSASASSSSTTADASSGGDQPTTTSDETTGGTAQETAGTTQSGSTTDGPPVEPPAPVLLGDVDRLIRTSMAIRGIRPSVEEMQAVALDPGKLAAYVDAYLQHPGFLETVKDLYAEALLIRSRQNDIKYNVTYAVGAMPPLDDSTYLSLFPEEPLELIARIVRDDLPFHRILTHDKTVVSWVGASAYRVTGYDMAKKDAQPFQEVAWADLRPAAGVLSHSVLWRRYVSNGKNYQRGRAAMLARVFLCDDYVKRDVPPFPDIDFGDEEKVRSALKTNPGCVSCHQTLDPLANFLPGNYTRAQVVIEKAHGIDGPMMADATCVQADPKPDCYPMLSYNETQEGKLEKQTGRRAGYYGDLRPDADPPEAWDVGKLGQFMAEDPRFAQCTARRFYSYMAQVDLDRVPLELIDRFAGALVGDDDSYNLRAMVREIVLSDEFMVSHAAAEEGADAVVGLKTARPEQLARTFADLTGFVWKGRLPVGNNNRERAGAFPLLGSDEYGYRAMAGGVDGRNVTSPTHRFGPMRMLTLQALAGEAAGFVVDRDFAKADKGKRKLLTLVDAQDEGEDLVKQQIAALHARVLGELVDPASPEVQLSYDLWNDAGLAPAARWKLLLAAMFFDHRIAFF